MPALAISLLGAPSVALPHGSTARGVGAAKGLALLAYLTLEPGSHSREPPAAPALRGGAARARAGRVRALALDGERDVGRSLAAVRRLLGGGGAPGDRGAVSCG